MAQSSIDGLLGRYESSRDNCTTLQDNRLFGSYVRLEKTGEAMPPYRLVAGAYEGEGGACNISTSERIDADGAPKGFTLNASCREEESAPTEAKIDLVPLFDGASLVVRRVGDNWISQAIYFRCDRQPGYSAQLHDPAISSHASNQAVAGEEKDWARPFICSYASGGTELSRDGCARQNDGEPEIMVWNNGNVVAVIDRGNGMGLLNARSARVEPRDDGATLCWIIDRTEESFCRSEAP